MQGFNFQVKKLISASKKSEQGFDRAPTSERKNINSTDRAAT